MLHLQTSLTNCAVYRSSLNPHVSVHLSKFTWKQIRHAFLRAGFQDGGDVFFHNPIFSANGAKSSAGCFEHTVILKCFSETNMMH